MRIAVDAMGGDYAPQEIIAGAVRAVQDDPALEVILVGDQARIEAELSSVGRPPGLMIRHAAEVVGMEEAPGPAIRSKRQASVSVATRLIKAGEAEALVTAGNSGAALAAATLYLRTVPGVARPGIMLLLPVQGGRQAVVMDGGANVDCEARHLYQFAHLANVYAKDVLGLPEPRVGLLNIGEEDGKGNAVAKQAFTLLRASSLNFTGNLDAKDVFRGVADVIVCDGFVGNVLLKVAESIAEFIVEALKTAIHTNSLTRLGGWLLRPALQPLRRQVDAHEYGGALLLGVNGLVVISHGRSNARAIQNAIRVAAEAVAGGVMGHIREAFRGESEAACQEVASGPE